MFKKHKEKIIIGIIGAILVSVVAGLVFTNSRTTSAIMLNSDQRAGTTITEDMIKTVDVPANTPGDFVKSKSEIVGYTLKNDTKSNEFIYLSSFLNNWEGYSNDANIPDDFIVTSIQIPDNRAVGGLITAGDYVDVLGVSNRGVVQSFNEATGLSINEAGYSERNQESSQVYYVLANVKILNTNSALSQQQGSEMNAVNGGDKASSGTNDGNYYIVALSYDDYKKLRQAEQVFDGGLWLNISPKQNKENEPLLRQMAGQSFGPLHNAEDPIQDKDGNIILKDDAPKADTTKEAPKAEAPKSDSKSK